MSARSARSARQSPLPASGRGRRRGERSLPTTILGGGPAGLYCALLLKKAHPEHRVRLFERNPAGATYGWGVVFSDRTLAAFREADLPTYTAITEQFVLWDAIDTYYRDRLVRCGGHAFAGLARKQLLATLQARCAELGVEASYETEVGDLAALEAESALVIAADGVNSLARRTYPDAFAPRVSQGKARYIWFGTTLVLDAFTFIFRENEHGFFQVHAYPFSGETSTFIVECDEATWRRAGLDHADEEESIAYCERLFAPELQDARLLGNRSSWISFPTLKCGSWRHGNVVLLGDSAHTAHFSIGSGTKLAMEDAIALANALNAHEDLETALNEYEANRRPAVDALQQAARESQRYFETIRRHTNLAPVPFTFHLLTRSGRISYDDLRLRDPNFGALVDRSFEPYVDPLRLPHAVALKPLVGPPPAFTQFRLGQRTVANRIVAQLPPGAPPTALADDETRNALATVGLILTPPLAISPEGRRTPASQGFYAPRDIELWQRALHDWFKALQGRAEADTPPVGLVLSHAGRRAGTQPVAVDVPPDRPLRGGGWPLLAPSAIPYAPRSQTPQAMTREDMDRVCAEFVAAAKTATTVGFDLLVLRMAHGDLLASYFSPLSNQRTDEYGGSLAARMRYPLEVFDAIRDVWPASAPLGVALNVDDCVSGGLALDDGLTIARALKAQGCDFIQPMAGQTVPQGRPTYGRGFLTGFCDRVRNQVGIPTLAGGYLTTTNEVNTVLAAGRADLCLLTPSPLPPAISPR